MRSDDGAVTMARCTHEAAVPAISAIRRWVTDFARQAGMLATDDVAVAVSEAVTNAVRHAYPPEEAGTVTVDAAADREWLTVRVADRGRGTESTSLGLGLPLMARLADRVEIGPRLRGPGTQVLMEFPIVHPVRARAAMAHRRISHRRIPRRGAGGGSARRLHSAHARR